MTIQTSKRPMVVAPPIFKPDGSLKIARVLIANRGEIACRIIATCRKLGVVTVAIYADEDQDSLHVKRADEAVSIGPASQRPYQNIDQLVQIAKSVNVDAIHPGYGYLSENADFAKAVGQAGIAFIGPSPDSIAHLGDKRYAKEFLSKNSSVPLIPGYNGLNQDVAHLESEATKIGYPILIKASAGGGGKGMRIVYSQEEFREAFVRCASEAERAFGSGHCLIEKYIERGKHVEIQVFGDGEHFISLLDRECSIQRRHQKVIEESPCPWISPAMRQKMSNAAIEIAQLLKYESAGTVEFIVDVQQEAFYFLEVNTRIQVEHPITEEVVGVDIVSLQLFVAAGGKLTSLPELNNIQQHGHAIEVRLCAENPFQDFLPCIGTVALFKQVADVTKVAVPDVRYEVGIEAGNLVSVHFDSMISKIIVWSHDRVSAIQKMIYVLRNTVCLGVTTNQFFLLRVLQHPDFQDTAYTTDFIEQKKDALLKGVDLGHVQKNMALAVVLYNQQLRKAVATSNRSSFASIPNRFRNQKKDKTGEHLDYVSCQLPLLGYPEAGEVLVSRTVDPDSYQVSSVQAKEATSAEQSVFYNKSGGQLTKRYYDSRKGDSIEILTSRKSSSPDAGNDNRDGETRLLINGRQHTFFVALLSAQEYKKEVAVYSTADGYTMHYTISSKLGWSGRFDERAAGGLDGAGGDRKYVSPMPCQILRILAADNTEVKVGDGLLVMESMKTEIRLTASAAGIVKMNVQEGATVTEGVVMCEIRAAEES